MTSANIFSENTLYFGHYL